MDEVTLPGSLGRSWRGFLMLTNRLSRARRPDRPGAAEASLTDLASGQFGGLLTHELNNALAVVLGAADIVEDAATPDEARGAAATIAGAAQEALDLSARLAALARRHALAPLPCDLAGTLAASRPRLERAAGGRGRLQMDLASRVLPAMIDRDQFLACIVELLIDARRASPHGPIALRTRLMDRQGPRDKPDREVLVEVEGSTEGEPLQSDTGAVAFDGGYALAVSFARSSGGWLDRTQHARFCRTSLRLPLIQPGAVGEMRPPGRPGARPPGRVAAPPVRAVVVEDNDFLRDLLVGGLRARGFAVDEARDAAEARVMLGTGAAVLVTDVVLPGDMDGFALARWARARDPRVALLFVSAFMSARLPAVLASDELASFVRKPIELEGMLAVLDGLLAVRGEHPPLCA
jgi:CheY-like chemotaxis protein